MDKPKYGATSWGWTVAAAVLIAFYLATSLYISGHRLLWYDELFAVLISRLPDTARILDALHRCGNDAAAPYVLLSRFSLKLFPNVEIASRLPSAAALAIGLLITFDCARRLTDSAHGYMAVAFLTCTLVPYYGYEARSYAIYFAFAATVFWVWNVTSRNGRGSACLFGLLLFAGTLFHHYLALCMVPFAIWEAMRWKAGQWPSPKLLAGLLGILGSGAILSRQIFAENRYPLVHGTKPSLSGLRSVFSELFPQGLFLLALLLILIVLSEPKQALAVTPMQPAEGVGWLCLAIPFVGYILAVSVTNVFVTRYYLGMAPGLAIAVACGFHRLFSGTRMISMGACLALTAVGAYGQLESVRRPELIQQFDQQTQTRQMLRLEDSLRADGKRYFLCANGMLYVEADYYSKHPGDYRLLGPLEQGGQSLNAYRYATSLAHYYAYQFWSLDDLKQHASETALIQPSKRTLELLRQAGMRAEVHSRGPLDVVYFQ